MARNWDLIRQILVATDNNPPGRRLMNPEFEGFSHEEVGYHIELMLEMGLVEARIEGATSSPYAVFWINRLTSKGQDFTELASDQSRWDRAMKIIARAKAAKTTDIVRAALEWTAEEFKDSHSKFRT